MRFHGNFPEWKMRSPAGRQMVIRHVLHYLIERPDAKDTIRGILRWWLPRSVKIWDEAEVQSALDTLVAKGWVTQRKMSPSQSLYGLNQDGLEDILAYLEMFL